MLAIVLAAGITVFKIHKTKRLPRISNQNERGLKEF